MGSHFQRDMTKGGILGHLIFFTIPMLIGNLFQQIYNMVDSIIVGKYVGKSALAAVGATASVNFLFFSLCSGLAIGIGVLVSQYFGAGEHDRLKKTIANSLYAVTAGALVMGAFGVAFSKPLLAFLRTPDNIIDSSAAYMRIICAGIIATALYNAGASILRALGDSTTPLVFLVISCFVNVGLDLWFVISFGLGVRGVAYATIIAQAVSAAGCLLYAFLRNPFFKFEREHRRPDMRIIKACFEVGLPVAGQSALIAVSCIAIQVYVNGYGDDAVAAFTAVSRIEQLVHQPFQSLSSAVATFAGQNMGAGDVGRVRKSYRISTVLYVSFSLMMVAVSRLFGDELIHIFVNEPQVISTGASALKITSMFYIMLGCIYITRGLLNGAGDTMNSLINGIVEVSCRIGFSLMFAFVFLSTGVYGAWYAQGLTWFVAGSFCLVRYLRGKWVNKRLVGQAY